MADPFTIGVFGIIFDEKNRVLLVHRCDYDLWNLPGGGLKHGESVDGGLKREVFEETNLNVEIIKLIGVYSKKDRNDIVFSFLCKIISGEIALNDEADKIEYFEIDKIPKNTIPKQVERIKEALENPSKTIFKTQTGKSSIELIKEGLL